LKSGSAIILPNAAAKRAKGRHSFVWRQAAAIVADRHTIDPAVTDVDRF
jgi:hypothetical protein